MIFKVKLSCIRGGFEILFYSPWLNLQLNSYANRPNNLLLAHFSCVVSGLSKEKVVTFDLGTSDGDQDPGGKCTMFLV